MIEDISKKIAWLENNPIVLKNINRGIEREALRIKKNGSFSDISHPKSLGAPLTHQWITTDFSENLLEFITPTSNSINYLLNFLTDLHSFVAYKINSERIWPFSIPYLYDRSTNIKIAEYGTSNIAKIKTLYRQGLKSRYGDLVNTISGVHYNFSLPKIFWKSQKIYSNKDYVSSGYLNLIRNYYRFGWIIPFLFGSSPAISKHFLKNKVPCFKKNKENILYLPWSTSLRLSDIGYTSTSIIDLNIMFNDLESYVKTLYKAIHTPSDKFLNIGLRDKNGVLQQINTNILQMESELYTQIRPKRNIKNGERLLDKLQKKGIEYVEIRSLDINPFSPIGINKNQILLLDLFLIWCALVKAPKMNKKKFSLVMKNWKKIIFEGRKPNQKIYVNEKYEKKTIIEIATKIFRDLKKIAIILDKQSQNTQYQQVCKKIMPLFYNPELTYSGQFLKFFIEKGIEKTGLNLANKYHNKLINYFPFNHHKDMLEKETICSIEKKSQIEKNEKIKFEDYFKCKFISPC